ncbi:MAG: S41 family peptidase [Bacteroidales bacterium]|nr:S41 family peptidase [Bacteroidales bacterium]
MKTIKRFFLFAGILLMMGPAEAQFSSEALKYTQFLNFLEHYYVDSVDAKEMVDDAIRHELEKLDPHSIYISAEDVQRMNEPLQGNFEGVGISFNILHDTLFVIEAIPGGPSEKVGIRAGDRILVVDDENIAGVGLTNDDVFRLLRGEKGTKVTVGVKRRNVSKILYFTVTRDKIPIKCLDAAYMATESIGYIKLNRFAMTTMEEFMEAAVELKAQGATDLILDLTGNTGGYLEMAVELADQFLANDELIVFTKGLNSRRYDYYAHQEGIFEDARLVILIDEESASASEIVSGAIQDWDRGIIIGRRSFGKGLVQRQLQFTTDGSMLRLTIAKYYTPTGRLIQKPYSEGLDAYNSEIFQRYENGEMMNSGDISFPDSLNFTTLKTGRTVYGGGGIMPDIFVPLDTTEYTDFYGELNRRGIINQFILDYVDMNREKLNKKYPSFDSYKSDFGITDEILNELAAYAEKQGLEVNSEEMEVSRNRIILIMKAFIARDIWSTNEFYQIVNEENDNFREALKVFQNWDPYHQQIVF